MRDPILFLSAFAAIAVIVIGTIALGFWRKRGQKTPPVITKPTLVPMAAADERRRKEEKKSAEEAAQKKHDLAVQEGRILADGRPRCQASMLCQEQAVYTQPSIERDEGVADFVRRAFGAPRRYRLVEGQRTDIPSHARRLVEWLGGEFASPVRQRTGARYCPTHVHVVSAVCRERLAADERESVAAELDREARLAQFESAGMESTARKLMKEIEDREAGKNRRKKIEGSGGQLIPIESSRPAARNG